MASRYPFRRGNALNRLEQVVPYSLRNDIHQGCSHLLVHTGRCRRWRTICWWHRRIRGSFSGSGSVVGSCRLPDFFIGGRLFLCLCSIPCNSLELVPNLGVFSQEDVQVSSRQRLKFACFQGFDTRPPNSTHYAAYFTKVRALFDNNDEFCAVVDTGRASNQEEHFIGLGVFLAVCVCQTVQVRNTLPWAPSRTR